MRQLIFTVLLCTSLIGYGQSSIEYEYLSVAQVTNTIYITTINQYEEIKVDKQEGKFDFKSLFGKTQEFQRKGWEIVNNNTYFSGAAVMEIFMRRAKS